MGRTDGLGTGEVGSSPRRVSWTQARRRLALGLPAPGCVGIGSGGGGEGKFGRTPGAEKVDGQPPQGLTSPPLTWVADDLKQAWGWVGLGANSGGRCLEEAHPKLHPRGWVWG